MPRAEIRKQNGYGYNKGHFYYTIGENSGSNKWLDDYYWTSNGTFRDSNGNWRGGTGYIWLSGGDHERFTMHSGGWGVLKLKDNANYESKSQYNFDVNLRARNNADNRNYYDTNHVTVNVNNKADEAGESFTWNNTRYQILPTSNWYEAETAARALGGHLVSVDSQEEHNEIIKNINPSRDYWIGYNDHHREGVWNWVNGSPATFAKWDSGQPDDHSGGQDFGLYWANKNGKWDDAQGSHSKYGIAEIKLSSTKAYAPDIIDIVDSLGAEQKETDNTTSNRFTTKDSTPTLRGYAAGRAAVNLWNGTELLGSSRAQDNHGLWDITSKELAPGDYELTVTDQGSDSVNNQLNITPSDRSEKFYITIEAPDSTPPSFSDFEYQAASVSSGSSNSGQSSSNSQSQLIKREHQISRINGETLNLHAHAVLKDDGSVVAWGDRNTGGNIPNSIDFSQGGGVKEIFESGHAFATLQNDGSVLTWGNSGQGGNSSSVQHLLTDVKRIFSTSRAFAALKKDGSVVSWGTGHSGGNIPQNLTNKLNSGVVDVAVTQDAFAAVKDDGSVVTWGDSTRGGDSSSVANQLNSGVSKVYGNDSGFAALKNDGSVVTWSEASWYSASLNAVRPYLNSDISKVYASRGDFAAIKNDGSIISWGNGASSSGLVIKDLQTLGSPVKEIVSAHGAFTALTENGKTFSWGLTTRNGANGPSLTDVKDVFSNGGSFAALKNNGSVVTWGRSEYGGNSSSVSSQLSSGVKHIYAASESFLALKDDGSIAVWGANTQGYDNQLKNKIESAGVKDVFANNRVYVVLLNNGSAVTFGPSHQGGLGPGSGLLDSGVVAVSDIYTTTIEESSSAGTLTVSFDENTAIGTNLFKSLATDSNSNVSYKLEGPDAAAFDIDSSTGQITNKFVPNYETKSIYNVNIIASDEAGNKSSKSVIFNINDLNQAPTITSSSTATAIDENTASSTVIYTPTGTDESAITWSLKNEYDYSKFSIDSIGNVSLAATPDYEVDGSQLKFTVSANDGTLTTDKTITLPINNLIENEFVINPENTTETKANILKASNTTSVGITKSHLFNINDVTGFEGTDWGFVRIPKKLRSILNYQGDRNANDYGWISFKEGKSAADLKRGFFRVFAKSEDKTIKKALTFKIRPESQSLSHQELAINKLNSWNLSKTKTWSRTTTGKKWNEISSVDSAVDNIFNKFKIDSTQENSYLDKFKQGTAKIAADTNNKMVIIDSSKVNNSLIVDSEIRDVDATRQAQIKTALKAEGLKVADNATIETPINELDFSVDTIANGTAVVQLILEEGDQNINRIIKTNSAGESYLYNSQVITYTGLEADFDTWLNNLDYSLSYYGVLPQSIERGKGDFTNITVKNDGNILQAFVDAGITATNHTPYIDGSAYLIDKDGDGDIEIVSAFLIDGGFFDTDSTVGLIRDPIIPIVSPIPEAPVVGGSAIVNDSTPSLSGTTDNGGNIIKVYAADGTTLLATTTAAADKSWSISDSDYVTPITDGQQILKVTASDAGGESTAQNFNITVDTVGPRITSSGTAAAIDENSALGTTIYTVAADDVGGSGVKANSFALSGTDAGSLTIDSATGAVTINSSPNFETKSSYSFTVEATDEANNTTTKDVTLNINNLNEGSSTFEIRGTAQVGETMKVAQNLHETAFDADNANGALAGSYSYQWQLSDNGGASWSTVATDANYKITTSDVNKKLRALITYTDDGGFTHTDVATNSMDTVSLAEVAVDTSQSLIGYQYKLQKSGSDVNLGGVLGYSNDVNSRSDYSNETYDLIVEAKTLTNGDINGRNVIWNLESFDVTLDFNYDLFSNWDSSGVSAASASFGTEVNNAKSHNYTVNASSPDSVRVTGATLSSLNGETGIQNSYKELFTLTGLKFDATTAKALADDGIAGNEFVNVDIKTNIYDTVFADYQDTNDDSTKDNAYIKSLAGMGYTDGNDGGSVDDNSHKTYIHNAYVDLDEQGTTLYTQRSIGSDDKTYLIRDGSTVDAKAWWANLGNYGIKAEDLNLKAVDKTNFKLMEISAGNDGYQAVDSYVIDTVTSLSGSDLIDGGSVDLSDGSNTSWNGSGSENVEISFKVQVDGKVGQRLSQLETDFYKLEGKDTDGFESVNSTSKLTNNMITFQGDLNFDGRVSMKDLAFLNAGKLNAIQNGNQAPDDVDANYDGQITATDLAILDRDWGGTIHSDALTNSLVTDTEWESRSWTSLTYMDGDVINNISNTEVDFKNSSFDAQKLVDSAQPDPLAGDIYSGAGNLYSGSSLFVDSNKDFSPTSDPITGYNPI